MKIFCLLVLMFLFATVFAEPTHHPCDVMLENLRAKRQAYLVVFEFVINNAGGVSGMFAKSRIETQISEMENSLIAYEKLYADHCIIPTSGFDDVFTESNKIGK